MPEENKTDDANEKQGSNASALQALPEGEKQAKTNLPESEKQAKKDDASKVQADDSEPDELTMPVQPEGTISEKQIKIIVISALAIIVIALLLWGMAPQQIYEVTEITDNPGDFVGQEINLKGVVRDWTMGNNNFTLEYSFDANITIPAVHTASFPEGFSNNSTVILKGAIMQDADGQIYMESIAIQIGCPSKY